MEGDSAVSRPSRHGPAPAPPLPGASPQVADPSHALGPPAARCRERSRVEGQTRCTAEHAWTETRSLP